MEHTPSSTPDTNSTVGAVAVNGVATHISPDDDDTDTGCCEGCCCLPLRYVVGVLGLLGCTVDYLLKFSISVAIVAMVNNTHVANSSTTKDQSCPAAFNASHNAAATMVPSSIQTGDYNWTLEQKGIVLGTFFWGYLFTKSIGGRIAEVVGARETMGVSLGLCGVLSLLCPTAAQLHPLALAGARLLMGIIQGPGVPAAFIVVARWSLPTELATMVAITYSGMALGALMALGVSGWVVEWLGWRWVFWGTGFLAITWTLMWLFFVRNTPQQHPFISIKEKRLLSVITVEPRRRVPWGRLVRCWPIYLLILAEFSNLWLQTFMITESPSFLTNQIGMSLKSSGWVGTAMTGAAWITCTVFGRISDVLLRHQLLSKVNIRRVMQATGAVLVLGGTVGVVWAGCREDLVGGMMVLFGLGVATNSVTFSLSPMDIAPNYVGTLSGLAGLGNLSGFLAPIVTSHFISQPNGWKANILLSGGMYVAVSVIYIIFITADVQDWNFYEEIPSVEEEQPATQKK